MNENDQDHKMKANVCDQCRKEVAEYFINDLHLCRRCYEEWCYFTVFQQMDEFGVF